MNCPDCRDSGIVWALLIMPEVHRGPRVALGSSPRPARCRCGVGTHAPSLGDIRTLLDYLRGPAAKNKYPGLVDVVELDPAWGAVYAKALNEVWRPGEPVAQEHRDHAWAAVEYARRPQGPKVDLNRYAAAAK